VHVILTACPTQSVSDAIQKKGEVHSYKTSNQNLIRKIKIKEAEIQVIIFCQRKRFSEESSTGESV